MHSKKCDVSKTILRIISQSKFILIFFSEYAQEFAEMLINHASDHELKITLGRHVRLLFGRCHYFQVVFLHIANESGNDNINIMI